MTRPRAFALALALALAACRPEFDESPGLVEGPRLLAVVAEPAEARPGQAVTFRPFVAAPEGQAPGELRWSFCQSPKPPADDNVVGRSCLLEPGLPLAWNGATAEGALPADACARFGPDPPPGDARPRDPDATGGFFQPVIVRGFGEVWAHPQRVSCALPSAPADAARAFAAGYRPNRNPTPPTLEARAGGQSLDWNALPRGVSRIEVYARWPAEDAETYLWWDAQSRSLRERRESMRLAWYVTGGRLDAGATGVDEGAAAAEGADASAAGGAGAAAAGGVGASAAEGAGAAAAEGAGAAAAEGVGAAAAEGAGASAAEGAGESANGWQLPFTSGTYSLWVVLRDARGGAGVAHVRARVVE